MKIARWSGKSTKVLKHFNLYLPFKCLFGQNYFHNLSENEADIVSYFFFLLSDQKDIWLNWINTFSPVDIQPFRHKCNPGGGGRNISKKNFVKAPKNIQRFFFMFFSSEFLLCCKFPRREETFIIQQLETCEQWTLPSWEDEYQLHHHHLRTSSRSSLKGEKFLDEKDSEKVMSSINQGQNVQCLWAGLPLRKIRSGFKGTVYHMILFIC